MTRQLAAARAQIVRLEALAGTDALMDIPNRRGFEQELGRAIAYIRRYRASGALMVMDVDRLKPINDTYGHGAGDTVLKAIADVMARQVRASDVFGRLGGDEFGLLLWNLGGDDARAKAAMLESTFDDIALSFDGQSVSIGVSIGVVEIDARLDAAEVVRRADIAMYARKAARRQR